MARPIQFHRRPVALAAALALAACLAQAQEAQRITVTGRLDPVAPSVAGFGHRTPLAQTSVPIIGGSVCLKFTAAGTFQYLCTFHTSMTGTVTVQ